MVQITKHLIYHVSPVLIWLSNNKKKKKKKKEEKWNFPTGRRELEKRKISVAASTTRATGGMTFFYLSECMQLTASFVSNLHARLTCVIYRRIIKRRYCTSINVGGTSFASIARRRLISKNLFTHWKLFRAG